MRKSISFCKSLNLKGRILVATEGLTERYLVLSKKRKKYMEAMQADERFKDTFFKIDPAEEMAFRKMFVRPRSELVALNLKKTLIH